MKYILLLFIFLFSISVFANKEREAKQAQLDQACEAARQKKLAPLRKKHVEECMEVWEKDRAYCEEFYKDYGDQSGDRAPLFTDLPECQVAFDYQTSYRERK